MKPSVEEMLKAIGDDRLAKAADAENNLSAAQEAIGLVYGERAKSYGNRTECFHRAAFIMNAIKDLTDENRYTGKKVALMMIAMKQARRQFKYTRDNNVDIIGYTDLLETLEREELNMPIEKIVFEGTNMNMTQNDGKESVNLRVESAIMDMLHDAGVTPEEVLAKGIDALRGKQVVVQVHKPQAKKKATRK